MANENEIERLTVRLAADTAQHDAKIEKSAAKIEEMQDRAGKASVNFGGLTVDGKSISEDEFIKMLAKDERAYKTFSSILTNDMKDRINAEREASQLLAREQAIEEQVARQRRKEGLSEVKAAEKENQRLMMEGQRITERYGTSAQKLAIEKQRLGNLLQRGAISAETYDRAIKKIEASLTGANKKQREFGISFDIWRSLMTVGLVGLGANLIRQLVEMEGATERFNTNLRESERLISRILERNAVRFSKEAADIDKVVNEEEKEVKLREKLAEIEKELGVGEAGGLAGRRKKALEELEHFQRGFEFEKIGGIDQIIKDTLSLSPLETAQRRLSSIEGPMGRLFDKFLHGGMTAKELENNLSELNKQFDAGTKQADELRKKLDELSPESKAKTLKSEVEKYAAELDKIEIKTASVTEKNSQVLAIEEKIAEFRRRGADVSLLESQKDQIAKNILNNEADKLIQKMEVEAAAIKHQGNLAKELRLDLKGLSEEKLQQVVAAREHVDQVKEANEAEKEAVRLAKEGLTPRQKLAEFREKLTKAKELFPERITDEIFQRALANARKEMERAEGHTERMARNMERVENAMAGTAAEAALIERQRELFQGRDFGQLQPPINRGSDQWAKEALQLWREIKEILVRRAGKEVSIWG